MKKPIGKWPRAENCFGVPKVVLWLSAVLPAVTSQALAGASIRANHEPTTPAVALAEFSILDVAVFLLLVGVVIFLVIQTRRLRRSELAVKGLIRRLIDAGEEERKGIARELHDDIGQRLSLAAIELDEYRRQSYGGDQAPPEQLNLLAEDLGKLTTDVHDLSHRLHSFKLQHLGLVPALREMCGQISSQHGVEIQLVADELSQSPPDDCSLCFYRIAQEALNNAVKHSHSSRVEVTLTNFPSALVMSVKDFGVGFDTSMPVAGLGLNTMRERLRLFGGRFHISSRPGAGTEVTAEIDSARPQKIA